MVYTAAWPLAESPEHETRTAVGFRANDTKPDTKHHTSRLEVLARRDARFALNIAAFIAELESVNPGLAALLVPVSPLVVLTASSSGASGASATLDAHAVPKAVRDWGAQVQQAAEQSDSVCGWYLVVTFENPTREQARAAKATTLARVSELGSDRGAWVGVGLRKGNKGEHLDVWLAATEAEAIALRDAHREQNGALVSLARMGTRRGKVDLEAIADPTGPKMLGHYSRLAGYVTRRQGERDTLLDFDAVGVFRGSWIQHRNAVVGAPNGRRCACCSRPLPPPKSTGRPGKFCGAKCKSKHHRVTKAKRDTKPDTIVSCRVEQREPATEPNPPSEFRVADHASEANTDTEPTSDFRVAEPIPTSIDTKHETEHTATDPLESAATFAIWFFGGEEPAPAELHAAVVGQLLHQHVAVPEHRVIERALRRAILATVAAA